MNQPAFSAPSFQGCGSSRTQLSVVTFAEVYLASVKVRLGPVRTAVRAPSVNVASTAPSAARTTVRAGAPSRSKRRSPDAAAAPGAGSRPHGPDRRRGVRLLLAQLHREVRARAEQPEHHQRVDRAAAVDALLLPVLRLSGHEAALRAGREGQAVGMKPSRMPAVRTT
ncbi:hypothetical protein ACFQ2B_07725 [Streptomyces stramineus]